MSVRKVKTWTSVANEDLVPLIGKHHAVVSPGVIPQGEHLDANDPIVLEHPDWFVDSGPTDSAQPGPKRIGGRPRLEKEATRRIYLNAAGKAWEKKKHKGDLTPPTFEEIAERVQGRSGEWDGVNESTVSRWAGRFALPTGEELVQELERMQKPPSE